VWSGAILGLSLPLVSFTPLNTITLWMLLAFKTKNLNYNQIIL